MELAASGIGLVVPPEWSRQSGYGVRFDWGLAGALALGPRCAALVIVDVLSFTTTVSVALDRGTRVYPYPVRDRTAADFATAHDARLAVRRTAVSAEQPWSLSPAALRRAPAPERLVLPSPNGSAISAAVSGVPVIAGSLRNASAVGRWLADQGWGTPEQPIGVIAAGEHWPDRDLLRPALEDLVGAGAVLAALADDSPDRLSPEAALARNSYTALPDVRAAISDCASGRELASVGFAEDVAIALEIDSSTAVPVLDQGIFGNAVATRRR